MKRFRFPLRAVVVLREHCELRAREAFGAAVHAYVRSEEELATIRGRVRQFETALSAGRCEVFSAAAESQSLAGYRRECTSEIEAERAMVAARAAMQQRRIEYLEAHRKLEVVNRLEEKARQAHRAAGAREEQAAFDELSGRRAALATKLKGPHRSPFASA
jgi:flagellar protein FliJ